MPSLAETTLSGFYIIAVNYDTVIYSNMKPAKVTHFGTNLELQTANYSTSLGPASFQYRTAGQRYSGEDHWSLDYDGTSIPSLFDMDWNPRLNGA